MKFNQIIVVAISVSCFAFIAPALAEQPDNNATDAVLPAPNTNSDKQLEGHPDKDVVQLDKSPTDVAKDSTTDADDEYDENKLTPDVATGDDDY